MMIQVKMLKNNEYNGQESSVLVTEDIGVKEKDDNWSINEDSEGNARRKCDTDKHEKDRRLITAEARAEE